MSRDPSPPSAAQDDDPKGFTLIEILLTVVVLGIGTVMVQQTLLRSAGLVSKMQDSLRAQVWLDERLWEAREKIVYAETPDAQGTSGVFSQSSRNYDWSLEVGSTSCGADVYALTVTVRRPGSINSDGIVRESYAALDKVPI